MYTREEIDKRITEIKQTVNIVNEIEYIEDENSINNIRLMIENLTNNDAKEFLNNVLNNVENNDINYQTLMELMNSILPFENIPDEYIIQITEDKFIFDIFALQIEKFDIEKQNHILGEMLKNDRLRDISDIWEFFDEQVQNNNLNIYSKIAESLGEQYLKKMIKKTKESVIEENLEEIMNSTKDYKLTIWENIGGQVKNKNIEIFEEMLVKETSGAGISRLVESMNDEMQHDYAISIINKLKNSHEELSRHKIVTIWEHLNPEMQKDKIKDVFNLLEKDVPLLTSIWSHTEKNVQMENPDFFSKIDILQFWYVANSDMQEDNIFIFDEIIKKKLEDGNLDNNAIIDLWRHTKSEVQDIKFKEMIQLCESQIEDGNLDNNAIIDLWGHTKSEVQDIKFKEIIQLYESQIENGNLDNNAIIDLWGHTNFEVQKVNIDIFDKILNNMKAENNSNILELWNHTHQELIKSRINELLSIVYLNKYNTEIKNDDKNNIINNINKISKINENIYRTLNPFFIIDEMIVNAFSEEQLIRITNYPEVQDYILRNNNNLMFQSIKHLMKKDENWVISLDKMIKSEEHFKQLIKNIENIDNEKITEEFIENFILVISDSENYFDIQNYDDVNNYSNKRNEVCLNILHGNFEDLPKSLKKYSENDLYKFALLEYKFGISLEEAKRIIRRYGSDSDKLPKNMVSEYIRLLKATIECDNIKDVTEYAIKNNVLEEPWIGFPNARNVEGKILNMFADLYKA